MYGTAGSSTYEETHKNTNDSIIKTYVDNWYKTNLNGYTSYMSTTAGFCNDRSIAPESETWNSFDTALGYGKNHTFYGIYGRDYPQFKCPQTNDLFTLATSTKGNKALTYPVGLLTADEIYYAGEPGRTEDSNCYLVNEFMDNNWTMSPINFIDGSLIYDWIFYADNYLGGRYSNEVIDVRPVINLSSDVEIISGDGTINNPYVVK